MAIFIDLFDPTTTEPATGYTQLSTVEGQSVTFSIELYETENNGTVGTTPDITAAELQVSSDPSPLGVDENGAATYSIVAGAQFTGFGPSPSGGVTLTGTPNGGSSTLPRKYRIEFTTNPVTTLNSGQYFRWQIVSSTGEVRSTNTFYPLDADNTSSRDDAFYQTLDTNFPNGVAQFNDTDSGSTFIPESIGPRQLFVTAQPELLPVQEIFDPIYTVDPGDIINVFASATYLNQDITTPGSVSTITVTWQKSFDYDPSFPGSATWIDIAPPQNIPNEANYELPPTATQGAYIFDAGPPSSYAQGSTLEITVNGDDISGTYYRALYSSSLTDVDDVDSGEVFVILITPEITIVTQPGVDANDTGPVAYAWGEGNPNNTNGGTGGGDIRTSVSAITSGITGQLSYQWQYRFIDQVSLDFPGNQAVNTFDFTDVEFGVTNGFFQIGAGGEISDSFLEIINCVYHDILELRVIITGNGGEQEVVSDTHKLLLRDSPVVASQIVFDTVGNVTDTEDFYGDVANRELLTQYPIKTQTFNVEFETSLFYGIDGNIRVQWQKSTDLGLNWVDVGDFSDYTYVRQNDIPLADQIEAGDIPEYELSSYTTIPYRVEFDQDAYYRITLQSTAIFTYDEAAAIAAGATKQNPDENYKIIDTYESSIGPRLDLYREIFLVNSPANADVFIPNSASFEVSVAATSNISNLAYKWQYSVNDGFGNPNGVWLDLASGPFYGVLGENVVSGETTSTLVITNATLDIDTDPFYRCVIDYIPSDDPGALNSITSFDCTINVIPDIFTEITTINSKFVDEFQDVEWEVSATSLSLSDIDFVWERSDDYDTEGQSATWNTVTALPGGGTPTGQGPGTITSGGTTTFNIGSVTEEDSAYYRVTFTSRGGITQSSSVAFLGISAVDIVIDDDLPSTISVVEGQDNIPFQVSAVSTIGSTVRYLYQYDKPGDGYGNYINFGLGANFETSTTNPYQALPFIKNDDWDDSRLRVEYSIDTGFTKFGIESDLIVRRQFYYFANSSIVKIVQGNSFSLDLRPDQTGPQLPTFSWEYSINGGSSWSTVDDLGAVNNQEIMFIADVNDVNGININGALFRCRVTLNLIDEMVYSRNNILVVDTTNPGGSLISDDGFGYTAEVELEIINKPIVPKYYSNEIGKTGASVGAVICIPKPPEFVNDNDSSVTDDILRWGCAVSGDVVLTGNTNSTRSGGSIYSQNRFFLNRGYNWIDESTYLFDAGAGESANIFVTPSWLIEDDRFPGFIELRGQWLLKSQFPLLYQIIGDVYGETSTEFKLPNPYAKRIMGTGAVDGRIGRTSVIPNFDPDGTSGGDIFQPGTIGGVFVYERSRQLPPGSPGISGEPDGTAGAPDPATFTLGSYRTDGWSECQSIGFPTFVGQFSYTVGPLTADRIIGPPSHLHNGVVVTPDRLSASSGNCRRNSRLNDFKRTDIGTGEVQDGPSYNSEANRGRPHAHGIDNNFQRATNGAANHQEGIGSTPAPSSISETLDINFDPGSTRSSLNAFLDTTDVALSNASRSVFDNAISFYFRNADQVPVVANYFRIKWLIKAY